MPLPTLTSLYCLQRIMAIFKIPWHQVNTLNKLTAVLESHQFPELVSFIHQNNLLPSPYPDWSAIGLTKLYCILTFPQIPNSIRVPLEWGWIQSVAQRDAQWVFLVYLPPTHIDEFQTRLNYLLHHQIISAYWISSFINETYWLKLPLRQFHQCEQRLLPNAPRERHKSQNLPFMGIYHRDPNRTQANTTLTNLVRYYHLLETSTKNENPELMTLWEPLSERISIQFFLSLAEAFDLEQLRIVVKETPSRRRTLSQLCNRMRLYKSSEMELPITSAPAIYRERPYSLRELVFLVTPTEREQLRMHLTQNIGEPNIILFEIDRNRAPQSHALSLPKYFSPEGIWKHGQFAYEIRNFIASQIESAPPGVDSVLPITLYFPLP